MDRPHDDDPHQRDPPTPAEHPDPPDELPVPPAPPSSSDTPAAQDNPAPVGAAPPDHGSSWFANVGQGFLSSMARGFLDSMARGVSSSRDSRDTTQPREQQQQQQPPPQPQAASEARIGRATLEPETSLPPQQHTQGEQPTLRPPTTIYYSLPFSALDGRRALLAIPGNFLPVVEIPNAEGQNEPPITTPGQRRQTRITVLAPAQPIYVPLGSSFLPFSFLYDPSGWAWPIISLQNPPADMPLPPVDDIRNPHFIAGPPFPLTLAFGSPTDPATAEEAPSALKAKEFADTLETADEELRSRMARLEIGDIGTFNDDDGHGSLGCPVCLDSYDESSDRPEWIGGQEARDNRVVVIPCKGFHSMHRRCLEEWLATKSPSKWSCPMCRSSISASSLTKTDTLEKAIAARSHSLREEIHKREKERGFLCDYQACFPDYEASGSEVPLDRQMVKISPCGHSLHVECLTTSMRIAGAHLGEEEEEDEDEDEVSEEDLSRGFRLVGKWVECPIDRKEGWAKIPVPLRFKGVVEEQAALDTHEHLKGGESSDAATSLQSIDAGTSLQSIDAATSLQSLDTHPHSPTCGQVHRLSSSPPDAPQTTSRKRLCGDSGPPTPLDVD